MARALDLARQGRGQTSPNPMVGAVVVRGGEVMGEGFHQKAGSAHAEVIALEAAGSCGRGATLYVTLEPCVHHGRTPPCVPLLIDAGLSRVVVAVSDPNPRVSGRGIQALQEAGLQVSVGVLAEEARELNRAFFTFIALRRPFVTLKAAMTLDGKIAAWDRSSRWISGEESRRSAHVMRSEADGLVVGVDTVIEDDPELTVRLGSDSTKEPYRIVVDSHLRIPLEARVLSVGTPSRTLLATTREAPPSKVAALKERGVQVVELPSRDGHVDLQALMSWLAEREVMTLLLEGGGRLNAAFLESALVDRVALFVAPKILGGERSPTPVAGVGRTLKDAFRVSRLSARSIGEDILLEGDIEYEE